MDNSFQVPFYAKAALIFISIFAFVFTLHVGQQIIVPILYAAIIAILLNPFVNLMIRKRVNKIVAISIALILLILLVFGIAYIISTRLAMFSDSYPQLKEKFNILSSQLVGWISHNFNIRSSKINTWITGMQNDEMDNFDLGEKLTATGEYIVTGMLIPAYIFMILFYKPLLLEFIRRLFRTEHLSTVLDVLVNSKSIIQSYLVGLFFEMIIVAVLNSAGLLLLGIDYAIVLGIIGAIINVIPYIGGVIAIILPMTIALLTKDSISYPLMVFLVYICIQFIDNHYIIPNFVARRVKINALVSVVVILVGAALWGIPGMFLSIPLTAIIKVIFDHIEPLKPWGFLLGNIVPTTSRFSFLIVEKIIQPKPTEIEIPVSLKSDQL